MASVLAMAGTASVAMAEVPAGWDVMVGGGAMVAPEYPGSKDYRVRPMPALSVKGPLAGRTSLTVAGPAASIDYEVRDRWSVSLKGRYDFGRDSDEDLMVRGLPEVDDGLELGPTVKFDLTEQTSLSAEMLTEVAGGHDGTRARVGVAHGLPLGQHGKLIAGAGVNYASDNYMEAYYGVPGYAARADRAAYSADGGISHVDAGLMAMMPVSERWVVQGLAGADYLVGEAADSPIVQRNLQPKVGVNLLYRF